jgi:hypothetical protein
VGVSGVAAFEHRLRQGEPHAGERPDRSPDWSASAAGKRRDAVATDRWAGSTKIREGEIGCVFDEIQNLVEPIERRYMDGSAGRQRGRSRSVADWSRVPPKPLPVF